MGFCFIQTQSLIHMHASSMDQLFGIVATGVALAVAFGVYYFFVASQKIRVYGSNKELLDFINRLPILRKKYFPAPLYINGITQTVFGISRRTIEKPTYTREIFDLSDGGQVALDWLLADGFKNDDAGTLVILIPGLTSSAYTSYVRTLVLACRNAGTSVVIVNHRGCGRVPLTTPRHYCAANCDDLLQVITYLHSKYPNKRKVGLGTSLGGIVMGQLLAKHPKTARQTLKCAILISIVWDCKTAVASMERPLVKALVNTWMVGALKNYVLKHRKILESKWADIDGRLRSSRTLREFDENFTSPAFGYSNIEEYYKDATLAPKIPRFSIPVFGLNAADDPVQPGFTLPKLEAQEDRSNFVLMVTASGGHLGFLEGVIPSLRPFHFMERFVYEFLQCFHQSEV